MHRLTGRSGIANIVDRRRPEPDVSPDQTLRRAISPILGLLLAGVALILAVAPASASAEYVAKLARRSGIAISVGASDQGLTVHIASAPGSRCTLTVSAGHRSSAFAPICSVGAGAGRSSGRSHPAPRAEHGHLRPPACGAGAPGPAELASS